MLEVKGAVPTDRHSSEKDIKALIHCSIIELCSREGTEESIVEDGEHVKSIFPKLEEHHVAVPSVGLSTVDE